MTLKPVHIKKGKHSGSYQLRAKPYSIPTTAINTNLSKEQVSKTVEKYKRVHGIDGYLTNSPGVKKVILRTAKGRAKHAQDKKKKNFLQQLSRVDASGRTERRHKREQHAASLAAAAAKSPAEHRAAYVAKRRAKAARA